jgi:hypothetical protein
MDDGKEFRFRTGSTGEAGMAQGEPGYQAGSWRLREFVLNMPFHGDEARAATAKLLDLGEVPGVAELMHYDDKGVAREGFSAVKFLGRKTGFAILGHGARGEALVDAFSAPIARAWACRTGRAVLQRASRGETALALLPFERKVTFRHVIVQKKRAHQAAFAQDPEGFALRLISRGIATQAQFLGLEFPEQGFKGVVTGINRRGAVVFAGLGGAALTLCDVELTSNLALAGMWSVGYLTSYGFGFHQAELEVSRASAQRLAA